MGGSFLSYKRLIGSGWIWYEGEKHAKFEAHAHTPDLKQNPHGECFLWDADNAMLDATDRPNVNFLPENVFRVRTQVRPLEKAEQLRYFNQLIN